MDGLHLSNTHLLEKRLGWTGILAEPARFWQQSLALNRSARIDQSCVWRSSGETLLFNEVTGPDGTDQGISTIDEFSDVDCHAERRLYGTKYEVESISLEDLLVKHGAPRTIDYLSIDTEGSELAILEAFNFDRFDVQIITCEHNFSASREKVAELLNGNGYREVLKNLSLWDGWFIRDVSA